MLAPEDSSEALRRLFARRRIVQLRDLFRTLDTGSRMSVFRRLSELGYRTSITHRGRYYTLEDIPVFDALGLWFDDGVGFSLHGTLKATLVEIVCSSGAGKTHGELEALVRTRTHDTLLDLFQAGRLGRRVWRKRFLYLSPDARQADSQWEARRRGEERLPPGSLPLELVVAVLLEVVQGSGAYLGPESVSTRLLARGVTMEPAQVARVYREYGIEPGKKTRPVRRSRSLPSSGG